MIMYVQRAGSDNVVDQHGPLFGLAKSAFLTKNGITLFFTQEEADLFPTPVGEFVRPVPGMIGRSMLDYDIKTFMVAADGEVYSVDLGWPTLQSYAKAVEKAADLERRNERLLKELLTEEAAIGLLDYVIDKYDHFNVGGNLAERIFEEFRAQQDG